jgi:integrin-linked kinase-associated serine/threonine phosphatase 2C
VLGRLDAAGAVMTGKALTVDHSPQNYNERKRIEKAGGRVIDGRVNGILEVSRSIGDGRLKHLGVSARPDVLKCALARATDRFLLLACDGLWKVLSSTDACAFVHAQLAERTASTDPVARYQAAVNALVNEAVRKGSNDNVTCVLVVIEWTG